MYMYVCNCCVTSSCKLYDCVDAEDVDRIALMKVFAILQQNDPRDGIIYVTATGDVPTLRKSLEKYPEEVGDIHIHIHVYTSIHEKNCPGGARQASNP